MKYYVGIDNGVTGTIAVVDSEGTLHHWCRTPVTRTASFYKKNAYINRIHRTGLRKLLEPFKDKNVKVLMEYPSINPTRFASSISAAASFEATWGVIEDMGLPVEFIPAIQWQKALLPGKTGSFDTKKASTDLARRLFPRLRIPPTSDGDALLLCEYARRNNL